jgi:CelD/BcsL family acetyltransferase involved in cellulose biosynthesis
MQQRGIVTATGESAFDVRLVPACEHDDRRPPAWERLAASASEPNAYAERWFVEASLTHLGDGRDIRFAEIWDQSGDLVGLFALTHQDRYGRMPARHLGNWMHYQCFMGTPLIARGAEIAVWRALISALDASDWPSGFLSLTGLQEDGPVHQGLVAATASLGREAPTVHRYERALLASPLDGDAYLETVLRGKKRKELRRLVNRLRETGALGFSVLSTPDQLADWCSDFLRLEAAGWKGSEGAALANHPATEQFFRDALAGAMAAGTLDFQRLDLDGRAIAMLVNFRTPPGSWSFKIAYDEALARFSPGVLIELENLPRVLADPEIDWMDSCAVADHPMINSLWEQRRSIIQVTVPLSGIRRMALYRACRAAETASARVRQFRSALS